MKRLIILVYFILFGLSVGFAQSGTIIDDIYVTPNEASMVQKAQKSRINRQGTSENPQSSVYRNGAKEIVFIDQNGNRTTVLADTLYVLDGEIPTQEANLASDSLLEEGYYLNGFKGTQSDFEYAERIRRFHNPKYTITIADPGYDDVFFLDNNYWNVYVDGIYTTVTPTWTNPYWWNYQYSGFGYNSLAWRYNWGYPSHYNWGLSSYSAWGYPNFGGYYGGWYDPWYSNYYGWGYPYYGGYYGWGAPYDDYFYGYGSYPYYGYGGGNWYNTTNQTSRRYQSGGRTIVDSNASNRRSSAVNSVVAGSRSTYSTVSRQPASSRTGFARNSSTIRGTRSTYTSGVDTRMRTGNVRGYRDWNNIRENNTRYTTSNTSGSRSSTIINRTEPSVSRNAVGSNSGRISTRSDSYNRVGTSTRSSGYSRSTGSESYQSGRQSSGYSSRSSSTYSSGSSSSSRSSSSTYSSGSSSSRSSRSSYSSGSSSSRSGSSRSSGGSSRR